MKPEEKIFSASGHLTREAMLRYGSTMPREEKYAVEKHVAGCSLCAEALEGAEKIRKEEQLQSVVSELHASLRKRMKRRGPMPAFGQGYIIAAIVFLIVFLLIVYIVFFRGGLISQ